MRSVATDSAPAALGPYSQAVEQNDMLFVSGQLPIDPVSGIIPEGVPEQASRMMENLRSIVESSGYRMSDCVRVTLYLTDLSDFGTVNEVYAGFFSAPFPARSCVGVSSIPKGASMEADAIFVRQRDM